MSQTSNDISDEASYHKMGQSVLFKIITESLF